MTSSNAIKLDARGPSLASPCVGRSLEGVVAPMRGVFIAAAQSITLASKPLDTWLADRSANDFRPAVSKERSRWFLAGMLLGCWAKFQVRDPRLILDALDICMEPNAEHELSVAARTICQLDRSEALLLAPYIFDTYGRTSRLDVMREQERIGARKMRKSAGSFYTPEDVADFMVRSISDSEAPKDEVWFDPAVGSGVFLLRALQKIRGQEDRKLFAKNNLFGADISPIACDFTAILLTISAADRIDHMKEIFSAIRHNIVAMDATNIHNGKERDLIQKLLPPEKPIKLICNPPYTRGSAKLGAHGITLSHKYLHFVQLALIMANRESDGAALVLPLAMGTNRSIEHRHVRSEIQNSNSNWTFLFFDRQPHALFGESAKTRATILLSKPSSRPTVRTSGLLKWTSKQRVQILDTDRAVTCTNNIANFVPKLSTECERELYEFHVDAHPTLHAPLRFGKRLPRDIAGTRLPTDVFISGTAYNFINVFRNYPTNLLGSETLSNSGVHHITCPSEAHSWVYTALLASMTTFWLWQVECDGFHVPQYFLRELGILGLDWKPHQAEELEVLGKEIWSGLSQDVSVSTNAGKKTLSFRPSKITALRRRVDEIILENIGACASYIDTLDSFSTRAISTNRTLGPLSKMAQ